MNSKLKVFLKIIVWVLVVLVIAFTITTYWLYTGKLTDAKISMLQKLPYPVAIIDGNFVPMKDYILRYTVAKRVYSAPELAMQDDQIRQQTYNQLIVDAQTEILAKRYGIKMSSKELDEEFNLRSKTTDLEGKKDFKSLIESYGLTEGQYKQLVIKPVLESIKLKVWFNSQKDLNHDQFIAADDIKKQLDGGANMAELAKTRTQDATGKSTEGDLGFIDVFNLIPELKEPVDSMNVGEVKIISSRFGIHIIKLEEKNENQLHLREIFLNPENYDNWFRVRQSEFKIKKLLSV